MKPCPRHYAPSRQRESTHHTVSRLQCWRSLMMLLSQQTTRHDALCWEQYFEVTQLERFQFYDWAAVVSCEAPHEQSHLNWGNIFRLLKVTQHLMLMLLIKWNHGGSFIENTKSGRRGSLTLLGRTRRSDGCARGFLPCVVESTRTEEMHEEKNMGIVCITKCNLRFVDLVDCEDIQVEIII